LRDIDIGKRISEEIALEPFIDVFPLITWRAIEIIGNSESPDFHALINGEPYGIEVN